eukprot:Protomagalhaensia_sp_Gyna_25__2633@NODE_24_length_7526_cov_33_797783_g17_i0_p3_GENE_NODE_24_length_7526_cov_33_797783_g17_i0NODE_24_length_7526_cov_33_797783_g17_i0_p3_ORF_typecomplete_len421_score45_33Pox_P35/PF03213_14/0_053_NODE_24_length_7526_cov_33_797783_g17_i037755037
MSILARGVRQMCCELNIGLDQKRPGIMKTLCGLLTVTAQQKLQDYLFERTPYPCFTNVPFSIVSSPRHSQRWSLIAHWLRGCEVILAQESFNGLDLRDLALFIPVDLLDQIVSKVLWFWDRLKRNSLPRREPLRKIIGLTYDLRRQEYNRATKAGLKRYGKGTQVSLAIYFGERLALWKLWRITRAFPNVPSPCVLVLEDDTVFHPLYWHTRGIEQMCNDDTDIWQLFYHHGTQRVHQDRAEKNQREYLLDTSIRVPPSSYWGACAVLWNNNISWRASEDIAFDDDDQTQVYLNCTAPECCADHFGAQKYKVGVPATPFIGSRLLATSLYRSMPLMYSWQSAQGQWAALYQGEVQTFGTVAMAMLDGKQDSFDKEIDRQESIQKFHKNSTVARFSKILNGTLGSHALVWVDKHFNSVALT